MEVSGSVPVNVNGGFGRNGETVLDEAARITSGDRNASYGHPLDNHSLTAEFWTGFLRRRGLLKEGVSLGYRDVCMLNIMQKVSRYTNGPTRDGLVDIAGFSRNIEMAEAKEAAARLRPCSVEVELDNFDMDAFVELLGKIPSPFKTEKVADANPSAPAT